MCGRFTLSSPAEIIAEVFETEPDERLLPRYNIAPSQPVAVVRALTDTTANTMPGATETVGGRELAHLKWGLIPSWAKDPSIGSRMINARAETVAEKPAYRAAFKRRRCVVPADGFYEWQRISGGKQPFYIGMAERRPFGMAGLWEHWEGPEGEAIDSCTILTTEPNEVLRPIHDRMPVILRPEDHELWLDPTVKDQARLLELLRPYAPAAMTAHAISTLVNNPKNDVIGCIEPLE